MNSEIFETDATSAALKQELLRATGARDHAEQQVRFARDELLRADHALTDYLISLEGGAA